MTQALDWLDARLTAAARSIEPYPHWLLRDVLPLELARGIPVLPFPAPEIGDTFGKRETHNSSRRFFGESEQADHGVCHAVAELFQSPRIVSRLQNATGSSLVGNFLRIEYCQDREGFWLEPHTDIGAKKFTMLVYLSDTSESHDWGTDIYDNTSVHLHLGRVPGDFNRGLIFVPGEDTWHGVEKRPYRGVRKSIIINYVIPEWRSRHELAFPDRPVDAL